MGLVGHSNKYYKKDQLFLQFRSTIGEIYKIILKILFMFEDINKLYVMVNKFIHFACRFNLFE